MILPIILYGEGILRKKGAKLSFPLKKEEQKLYRDMLETMRSQKGIGLAAQQVGHAIQLAVVDVAGIEDRPSKMWIKQKEVNPLDHMPVALINAEISLVKTKEIEIEGCLSFPGIDAHVSRSKRVKVKTFKLDGSIFEFEAAGLLGRAIQHEFDHLQGVLLTDRMQTEERKLLREKLENIRIGKVECVKSETVTL